MKSIAQILHHKTFPLIIYNEHGAIIYYETSGGFWRMNDDGTSYNHILFKADLPIEFIVIQPPYTKPDRD